MHAVVTTVVVALSAFVGTMVDNFFALAAQITLTEPHRHSRVGAGHFAGVLILITLSVAVGASLTEVPIRWVGALAVAPLALGWHAWRHRNDAVRSARRGWVTTMSITVALGGDNIAVWIPILRAGSLARGAVTVGIFILCDLLMIELATAVARHPRAVDFGQHWAPRLTPPLYVALGVLILWQCRWF